MPVADGLLLANHEERCGRICKEVSQLSGTSQLNPYPSTRLAQHGHLMALSHLGPRFGRASQPAIIWVHMDIGSYRIFYQWAEAVPLRKATGGAVANFIKENIIVRFGVPYRIISDNNTPFVNSDVRRMLEFYQVKHHRSSPYYPQGNGQAEAINKTLIKIISKMSQEYTGGWAMHLPDAL